MEDAQIVELYWQRDERAIEETDRKYGRYCHAVALNLLSVPEDAEECVSDTWQEAWGSMPAARPERLRPWLGRVVRNLAVDRYRRARAQKRYGGMETLLSELDECVPAAGSVEDALEAKALGEVIDGWLRSLRAADRALFVRRYFDGARLKDLAAESGEGAGALAKRMHRLRLALRAALEQEGITL